MNLRTILVVLALGFSTLIAQAHDFVSERAWVEDPAGTMTLAEVAQAQGTPFENKYFTRGFSQSTFWLRLRIDPRVSGDHAPAEKLIIRIRPPYQDQIRLYDPLAAEDQVRQTGDYFDWARDEYRSLNLNFVIPVGDTPRDVWLRLRTNQSTMTVIDVMSEDETRAADRRQEIATTLYFALLLVCVGWAVLSYLNQRDRLVGLYIVREALAMLYAMTILGYCRVFTSGWLPEGWLDKFSNVVVWGFLTYVVWFDIQLIRQFKPPPLLLKVLNALLFVLPLNLLLALLGKTYLANMMSAYPFILAVLLILLAALMTRAWDEAKGRPEDEQPGFSKAFLVGVYAIGCLVMLINRLPAMGYIQPNDGVLYMNLLYAALTSVTMMILIQVRAYRLAKRQQQAQHRLEVARLEAAQERTQRVEQSNFLKMLAHEMKTPLSIVRMATGSGHQSPKMNQMVERAVQDMNGIIERLLEVERLADQQIVMHPTAFCLREMLVHVGESRGGEGRLQIEGPDEAIIVADQRFVQIVLANLVDNALKYGAVDQPVRIRIEVSRPVVITVCNAIGTAGTPDPAQVFEKYYRAPGAHEKTGSGLGLYLARSLVTLLGGHIGLTVSDSTVCFTVELPSP